MTRKIFIILLSLSKTNYLSKPSDVKEIDGISSHNWKLLEKVKTTQRQDHLKVN